MWRSAFLDSLRKKCHSLSTNPTLTDILLSGLQSWLDQTAFDTAGYPQEYAPLLLKQQEIGWKHIFQGCLTLSWQRLQQHHYMGQKPVKRRDGVSWTQNMISHKYTDWISLWESCNKSGHSIDSTTRATYQGLSHTF
jgi:hypothetical protein